MRTSVISDEISQDMDEVLEVCRLKGLRTIELRAVDGRSILEHSDPYVRQLRDLLDAEGIEVCAIASPFLKCHLRGEGAPQGATHFASLASREEQWRVLERSIEVAHILGAPIVRAFSFWRLPDPATARDEILEVLAEAVERTRPSGLRLGLENEHACNIATGEEARWYLERLPSPTLGLIWDPGNEAAAGSNPYPDGYRYIRDRVIHVHVKDLDSSGRWTVIGQGSIDYVGQLQALAEDGYDGPLSIETHMRIPEGPKEATMRCIDGLREVASRAGVNLE